MRRTKKSIPPAPPFLIRSDVLGGVLLLAVYAIAVVLARALLYQAGEPRWSITLSLATMLQLAVSLSLTRFTEDVVVASLIFALLALAAIAWLWRKGPDFPPLLAARPSRLAVVLALLALFLVCWAALGGYWWDESFLHYKLSNVLGRGVVPPVHPLYPLEPMRYHYGYDFLAGQIRAFTGLSIVHACDVVTIWSFILLLMTASALGGSMGQRRGASLAMILVPFGTGLLRYLLFSDFGTMQLRWSAIPQHWFDPLPPPTISNFFQHPQGLGMPISLAVLVLFDGTEVSPKQRLRRTAIGALLLGLLSIANFAFFLMLGAMLGLAILWRAMNERAFSRALGELALLLGSLVIAFLLGGVFEPGGQQGEMLTLGRSFFPDPIPQRILRYLVLFGVPLLALPFAFAKMRRRPSMLRVALFWGATIGYLLPNFVVYERSWDIVKFLGIATFFANALVADLLVRARPITVVVVGLLTTLSGWAFLARMSVMDGRLGVPRMHFGRHHAVDDLLADQLSPLVAPRQRVLSMFEGTAQGGGFLTPGFRWQTYGATYMMERAALDRLAAHHTSAARDLDANAIEALDVHFLVLRRQDLARLSPAGKRALEDPTRFVHLFDVELRGERRSAYRIIRLTRG
jgi:hypothetical protein